MNQPADKPISAPISALEALERAQWIAFAPFVFQAACVLRDRGVLAAIEASRGGLTLDETAAAAELPIYGTRVLLEAGLGIGIVVEVDGRYRLTKDRTFLLHDPMTRANMDFTRDVNYLGLAHLGEASPPASPPGSRCSASGPPSTSASRSSRSSSATRGSLRPPLLRRRLRPPCRWCSARVRGGCSTSAATPASGRSPACATTPTSRSR
jgi:hypothetical protein